MTMTKTRRHSGTMAGIQRLQCLAMLLSLVSIASLVPPVSASGSNDRDSAVVKLTTKDYDAKTNGKVVFIKFFAPWCAHCKRMANDWEKLAKDWKDDEVGLIGEVDCTNKIGKQMCKFHDIESFPTIKYGNPYDLEEYNGGRSYEDLSTFAKENLKPICSPSNVELCDEESKTTIETYLAMPPTKLAELLKAEEQKLTDAETKYQEEMEKLQEQYEQLEIEKKETIAAVRNGDIGIMRSISKAKSAKERKEKPETTKDILERMKKDTEFSKKKEAEKKEQEL